MKLFAKGKGDANAPAAQAPAQPIDRTQLLAFLGQLVNSGGAGVLEVNEPRGSWTYAFQGGALTHASGGGVRGARQAFDLLWEFQAGTYRFTPGPSQLSSNLYIDRGRLVDLLQRSQAVLQGPASPYIPPGQQRPVAPVNPPYQQPPQAGWPMQQPAYPPQQGQPYPMPPQPGSFPGNGRPGQNGQPFQPGQPFPPAQPFPTAPQQYPAQAQPYGYQPQAPAYPGQQPFQAQPPVQQPAPGQMRPQPPVMQPPVMPSQPLPAQPVPPAFAQPQPQRPAPSFSVPPMPLGGKPKIAQPQAAQAPAAFPQAPAGFPQVTPAAVQPGRSTPIAEPAKPAKPVDDLRALRAQLASQAPAAPGAPAAAKPAWGVRTPEGAVVAAPQQNTKDKKKGKAGKEKAPKAQKAPKAKRKSPLGAALRVATIKFLLWACERKYSEDDHWTLKDAFEVSTMELRDQFIGAFSQSFKAAAGPKELDDDDFGDTGAVRGRARPRKR